MYAHRGTRYGVEGATGLESVLFLRDRRDTLKMLRETLVNAARGLTWMKENSDNLALCEELEQDRERIFRMIADIDRQRPLGWDGKHRNQHTATCGCWDR